MNVKLPALAGHVCGRDAHKIFSTLSFPGCLALDLKKNVDEMG